MPPEEAAGPGPLGRGGTLPPSHGERRRRAQVGVDVAARERLAELVRGSHDGPQQVVADTTPVRSEVPTAPAFDKEMLARLAAMAKANAEAISQPAEAALPMLSHLSMEAPQASQRCVFSPSTRSVSAAPAAPVPATAALPKCTSTSPPREPKGKESDVGEADYKPKSVIFVMPYRGYKTKNKPKAATPPRLCVN